VFTARYGRKLKIEFKRIFAEKKQRLFPYHCLAFIAKIECLLRCTDGSLKWNLEEFSQKKTEIVSTALIGYYNQNRVFTTRYGRKLKMEFKRIFAEKSRDCFHIIVWLL